MDEYISKTKFEELMRKKARNNFDLYYASKSKHYHDSAIGYNMAADEAHDFPSADVQPVKCGEWEMFYQNGKPKLKCTNCHSLFDIRTNDKHICIYPKFCEECGADMRNVTNSSKVDKWNSKEGGEEDAD